MKGGLFRKHRSFLSNPLLLSIMLLTYGENAEIPTKLSLFYNQAYETLFHRHDALKSGYRRERCTTLDIQDFAKVFSVFCLLTYDKRQFSFSKVDLLNYIDKSKKYFSMIFSSEGYVNDSIKATCLLIEDGLKIVFSHRSFQEYFVAYYINNAHPEIQKKLINKYSSNTVTDSVLHLLYEINSSLVERDFIVPELRSMYEYLNVKDKIEIEHYAKWFKTSYLSIDLDSDKGISATVNIENNYYLHDALRFSILVNNKFKIKNFIEYDKLNDQILDKYKDESSDGVEYSTNHMTTKSQLLIDVGSSGGFLSIDYLQAGYDLFNELKIKHSNIEESLDELLSS